MHEVEETARRRPSRAWASTPRGTPPRTPLRARRAPGGSRGTRAWPEPRAWVTPPSGTDQVGQEVASTAPSARACSSSSVRSWIGWRTKTTAGSAPSAAGLGLGRVDELGRGDEHARDPGALEVHDVVHTARRARASIGECLDHDVALLRDLVAQVDGRGLRERRLGETLDAVAAAPRAAARRGRGRRRRAAW